MYLSVTNINVELLSLFHHRKAERLNGLYDILLVWVAVNNGAAACKVYLHTLYTGNLLDCGLGIALAVVAVHAFYCNCYALWRNAACLTTAR